MFETINPAVWMDPGSSAHSDTTRPTGRPKVVEFVRWLGQEPEEGWRDGMPVVRQCWIQTSWVARRKQLAEVVDNYSVESAADSVAAKVLAWPVVVVVGGWVVDEEHQSRRSCVAPAAAAVEVGEGCHVV